MTKSTFKEGLEDIVALQSAISFIDGQKGQLLYGGYDIHDLVANTTFEEVAYLLWYGELPNQSQLTAFEQSLRSNMELPGEIVDLLKSFPKDSSPMAALRTAVSALGLYDPEAENSDIEAQERKAVRLLARIPTLVAFFQAFRNGREPLNPKPELSIAANFLYMLNGEEPDSETARMFDVCLILHADHELNASTFSSRVTTATLSDFYSAITSAIGTLKGPLHGGANERVMKMLVEIGDPDKAEDYVKEALARKEKVMGFGHRVYRTGDPRAQHLRKFSQSLGEKAGQSQWFEMSQKIERYMVEEKGINANVDFYSASTYYALGIPTDLFTPIFAMSRVSGWAAHVLEQYRNNRLIRPRAEYVGPSLRKVPPMESRSA